MKLAKWTLGGALACCLVFGQNAVAQGNSQGHGHGKGRDKQGDDQGDNDQGYYHGHDKDIHNWYGEHANNLPPGLAKKDRLPPDPFTIQEAETIIAAIHHDWGEAQGNYEEFRFFTGLLLRNRSHSW